MRTVTLSALLVLVLATTTAAQIIDTTIYDIRQSNGVTLGDSVRVTNVVVIGVDVRPGTYGVYIQEQAGGAFSGILAYRDTDFPAYENTADEVLVGDVLEVEGVVTDFGGLAEITSPLLTKLGTTTPLAPEVLPPDSLSNGYPGAERWEGVLVQVQNVVITSVNQFNNWYFHTSSGLDSLSGYEKMISGQVVPQVGDTLVSATGVADWAFSERRIAPRNSDDIIFASQGPPPVPNLAYCTAENSILVRFNVDLDPLTAEDTNNYSLSSFDPITAASYDSPSKTVTLTTGVNMTPSVTPHTLTMQDIRAADNRLMEGVQNTSFIGGIATIPFIQDPVSASNDSSQIVNQQVSFRGVVTAGPDGVDFPSGLGGFYVQDRSATEYAGLFVFGSPTVVSRNDSVLVSGIVTEFGVGPETEIISVDLVQVLGTAPEIAPISATLTQISGSDPAEAEKFESTLVQVNGVNVITQGSFGEPFDVTGSDTVRVDDLAVDEGDYAPWVGDVLDVAGIIRFSGSAPFRRLQPRNWNEPPTGDIHVVSKTATTDVPGAGLRDALSQNYPNPFNPMTQIDFSVARAGRVELRVFDLRGRQVRSLINEDMQPGLSQATWNGLDDEGRRVGSGLYFYRLITPDNVIAKKMLLLK